MARARKLNVQLAKDLLESGMSGVKIAAVCGVSPTTVYTWINEVACVTPTPPLAGSAPPKPKKRRPTTEAVKAMAAEAREMGLSYGELEAKRHPVEVEIPPGLKPAGRKPDGGLEQYNELELLAELSRRVHQR